MPPIRRNIRVHKPEQPKPPEPKPEPEPIDVDDVFGDIEEVEDKNKQVHEISPARARAQGINVGFLNFPTAERLLSAKEKAARKVENKKRAAIDVDVFKPDAKVMQQGPSQAGPSRLTPSSRGASSRPASVKPSTRARGPQNIRPSNNRGATPTTAIIVIDDDDSERNLSNKRPKTPFPVSASGPARGRSALASSNQQAKSPEADTSYLDDPWFDFVYEDVIEKADDPMDVDDLEPIASTSKAKGKERAVVQEYECSVPVTYRRHEMARYETYRPPTSKSQEGKKRPRRKRLHHIDMYDPWFRGSLTAFTRQPTMHGLACHRSTLSSGLIPRADLMFPSLTRLSVTPLVRLGHYKKTSGAVTKIVQSDEVVAIASATSGGQKDEDMSVPPTIDPYNRDGNLIFWARDSFMPPKSKYHWADWDGSTAQGPLRDEHGRVGKYYTVNDIAFDPENPKKLVSTGNDCCVHEWSLTKVEGKAPLDIQNMLQFKYSDVVNDVQFRPGAGSIPLIAVSCFDGFMHFVDLTNKRRSMLRVVSDNADANVQKPGAFVWGAPQMEPGVLSSRSLLYASTEAPDELGVDCRHVCLDVNSATGEPLWAFDSKESGDNMALDAQGETLALFTSMSEHRTLALYDVSAHHSPGRRRTSFASVRLPPPDNPTMDWEVNNSRFSQDGVYIALGLSDDRVLVYDSRFISNGKRGGPCLTYDLGFARKVLDSPVYGSAGPEYGVTALEWVPGCYGGRGLGLLTGGADGCMRLWDVAQGHDPDVLGISNGIWSPKNIIASVDHAIACASVGRNQSEHRLVVGDVGGEVHVMA